MTLPRRTRLRFAPSPTGPLHPGGVRTALYNYLFAKQQGGDFILRIEDTDQNRLVPGAEQFILDSLAWCGISFDEGPHIEGGKYAPYRQSERKHLYHEFAQKLIQNGAAYHAFDTPEDLEQMRETLKDSPNQQYNALTRGAMKNAFTLPQDEVEKRLKNGENYVIRFKMPENELVHFNDLIRGKVSVNTNTLDDKVLFKADGMPTYHLANVVDDYLMQITHVVRGEEWLPSAPLHQLLYTAFGWLDVMPQFAHLPLLLKPNGNGKLSKRDGDQLGLPFYAIKWTNPDDQTTTLGYQETGYLPEAYINFLALLGWNDGTTQEFFDMETLIKSFEVARIHKSGARYDFDKLKFFNEHYLHHADPKKLADLVLKNPDMSEKMADFDQVYLEKVCDLVKERLSFTTDFWAKASYFFEAPTEYDAQVVAKKWKEPIPKIMTDLAHELEKLEDFTPENIQKTFETACAQHATTPNAAMQCLRLAISGQAGGAALFEMAATICKPQIINRLLEAVRVL